MSTHPESKSIMIVRHDTPPPDPKALHEANIQNQIFRQYNKSWSVGVPNYTPLHWWECDVWAVMRSGYVVEYEVKRTMGDFRKDKKKRAWIKTQQYSKYDLLENVDKKYAALQGVVPNRFMYVVTEKIVDKVLAERPPWAGVLVARAGWAGGEHLEFTKLEEGRLLHKTKCNIDWQRLACNLQWRYWNTRK